MFSIFRNFRKMEPSFLGILFTKMGPMFKDLFLFYFVKNLATHLGGILWYIQHVRTLRSTYNIIKHYKPSNVLFSFYPISLFQYLELRFNKLIRSCASVSFLIINVSRPITNRTSTTAHTLHTDTNTV